MILLGDCRSILPTLDAGSVRCCVCSPPYWGLRSYGIGTENGEIGLEKTPEEYVAEIVKVFREVRRVLADDGTLWLNLGDSYRQSDNNKGQVVDSARRPKVRSLDGDPASGKQEYLQGTAVRPAFVDGLKPKDLVGIPWRVAFALQADGWTLRSEIIWQKPNPMPESVTDRPTKAHEQVFLFSKAKWIGPERRRFADISDQDARWLALFLDTEGNICAKRVQREEDGRTWYGTQISFANTSRGLLEVAQKIVGKGTILERRGKNARMFYYQLGNQEAADLLHRLYPFLIVKRRQAALGIYVQQMLAPGGKTRPGRFRHPDLTRSLEAAWAAMKSLNHFGSPDLSEVPEPAYGRWDSARYHYDANALREPSSTEGYTWEERQTMGFRGDTKHPTKDAIEAGLSIPSFAPNANGRNARSVWTIPTQPTPDAHFATFPEALAERCILAGSAEGDTILDPFFGSGTVGRVAERLGRKWIGIELNGEYVEIAKRKTAQKGLFMEGR